LEGARLRFVERAQSLRNPDDPRDAPFFKGTAYERP
jgi:hypothetical protein